MAEIINQLMLAADLDWAFTTRGTLLFVGYSFGIALLGGLGGIASTIRAYNRSRS